MIVNSDGISDAIQSILQDYQNEITDGVKKEIKKFTTELVKETKEAAPVGKRSQHYKEDISQKTLKETSTSLTKVWYVKGKNYRLTHLINNGHATRNGGRVAGTHFINNVYTGLEQKYIKRIEEVCER